MLGFRAVTVIGTGRKNNQLVNYYITIGTLLPSFRTLRGINFAISDSSFLQIRPMIHPLFYLSWVKMARITISYV
jgi:hypothetical protein